MVGEVLEVEGQKINIHWYHGESGKKWRPWNIRKGGEVVPFTELVAITDLYHHSFLLLKSGKLPQAAQDKADNYWW